MSDDILHTGRADIRHPKGPLTALQSLSRAVFLPQRVGQKVFDAARECYERWRTTPNRDAYVGLEIERAARAAVAAVAEDVAAGALHSFAAEMRTLAGQAPEGEPAAWPWTAYALAAVKAEEHAGKGFPSDAADRTPDVGTPDHPEPEEAPLSETEKIENWREAYNLKVQDLAAETRRTSILIQALHDAGHRGEDMPPHRWCGRCRALLEIGATPAPYGASAGESVPSLPEETPDAR